MDAVVLASGDGDFDLALQHIHSKYGVQTEVYGVRQLTAGSLVRAAQTFHEINGSLLLS